MFLCLILLLLDMGNATDKTIFGASLYVRVYASVRGLVLTYFWEQLCVLAQHSTTGDFTNGAVSGPKHTHTNTLPYSKCI